MNFHMKLKGEYKLVLNEGTDREYSTGWFPNIVTDIGLNRQGETAALGTSRNPISHIHIGTGTNAAVAGDVSMQANVATVSATGRTSSNAGNPTYAGIITTQGVYAQGAVVGNMAEIGAGWSATHTGTLFSRSRIVDGAGTPTTLTVVAMDQLTVYYRVTITPSVSDVTSSVTISGTSYNYTARMADLGSFMSSGSGTGLDGPWVFSNGSAGTARGTGSTLGAVTSSPSGGTQASMSGTRTLASYTNGTFFHDATLTSPVGGGNTGTGILTMYLTQTNANYAMQYSFSPAIPKDNTKVLTLVIRTSWSR